MSIYRKAALDKLSSPEKLDMLIRVINPRGWLFLLAFGIILTGLLAWGFFGQVKTQVSGAGLLVGDGVYEPVPLADGQVLNLEVRAGDDVKKGDVIAIISQFSLEQEIAEAKSRAEELRYEFSKARTFGSQDVRLQGEFIGKQRANIELTISLAERNLLTLEEQLRTNEDLYKKGLITKERVTDKEKEIAEEQIRIKSLRADIQSLNAQQSGAGNDLEQELITSEQRINENERLIRQLETQFEKYTTVRSAYDGKVIEVLADVGDVVHAGMPLVKIGRDRSREKSLKMIMYLDTEDGKKVKKDMEVLVVPSTVKAQEYGYMVGHIVYVSEYPATPKGMLKELKNEQLVEQLARNGAPFEVIVELEPDPSTPSGYKWTSGEGPPHEVFEGTPCTGRVTIDTQKPVTLVVPALKPVLE